MVSGFSGTAGADGVGEVMDAAGFGEAKADRLGEPITADEADGVLEVGV